MITVDPIAKSIMLGAATIESREQLEAVAEHLYLIAAGLWPETDEAPVPKVRRKVSWSPERRAAASRRMSEMQASGKMARKGNL